MAKTIVIVTIILFYILELLHGGTRMSLIEDGVLVTGNTPISVSSGEWTVLVTLDRQKTPSRLRTLVSELNHHTSANASCKSL
jgi:hypothetical protein